jgi:RNA polymerase sigma factor (sigma-70 family)
MIEKGIDHLFRHQYGKMVSILTRMFGLSNLELVEDAIQDTFIQALKSWRNKQPENPEAWLMQAAKHRAFDLLRKLSKEQARLPKIESGPSFIALNELFLKAEIEDSQLRMIFTACHPKLQAGDQIAFALKTISGFSMKEIADALLLKPETIKKRLSRARKTIQDQQLRFEIPQGSALPDRLVMVQRVIYLIFNEGFHSGQKESLIREELCGEALRLCRMLVHHQHTRTPDTYALFAFCCFQSARLRSKLTDLQEVVSLEEQDRNLWDRELIKLGHRAMQQAVETESYSTYHYEAAIVAEHLKAASFQETNWNRILRWYTALNELLPSTLYRLHMAMAELQRGAYEACLKLLDNMDVNKLEHRQYLFYGLKAEYYHKTGEVKKAIHHLSTAISLVTNEAERQYLLRKQGSWKKSV